MRSGELTSAVLDFWFGATDSHEYGKPRSIWFNSTPAFDDEIRARFGAELDAAVRGEHDAMRDSARGALALIVMFDQFPRNIFRGTPRAFATDAQARAVADYAIAKGFDAELPLVLRLFVYLPFEHSERLEDQHRAVELYRPLADDEAGKEALEYGLRHLRVIERFGRFPHRNAALGRQNTPDEAAYLASGDRPF